MVNLCVGNEAHDIRSLRVEEGVETIAKTVIGSYKVFCTKCGMTLEEIRAPEKATRRRRSKPETAAPATGSALEVDPKNLD